MQKSFDMFEWSFLAKKKFSKFLDCNDEDVAKTLSMYKTGFCYPLAQRDEEGCRIMMFHYSKWNPDEFTPEQATRVYIFVLNTILEEEEMQIAGVKLVLDFKGFNMKHAYPPMEFMALMDYIKKCAPVRPKGIFLINAPAVLNVFLDILRSVLKEKIQGRIYALKTPDDLQKHLNINLLPKPFISLESAKTESEMVQEFSNLSEKNIELHYGFVRFKIDWEKAAKSKLWSGEANENVGSFRSLQID